MMIRRMLEEDLSQVCELEKSVTALPWSRSDFDSAMRKRQNIYLVAEQDGEVLGFCGMWGVVGEGQIYNVVVKESARRQGIGYSMMSLLLDIGRDQHIKEFTLEVRVGNEGAIRLYKQLGFREEGIHKDFYSFPKEDALIMWL